MSNIRKKAEKEIQDNKCIVRPFFSGCVLEAYFGIIVYKPRNAGDISLGNLLGFRQYSVD